jgi:hypothetical protein
MGVMVWLPVVKSKSLVACGKIEVVDGASQWFLVLMVCCSQDS